MSELGPDAREILRNGRNGDDPSPADRTRIHAALMAAIAAGAVTTAVTAASASTSSVASEVGLSASVGTAKSAVTSLFGSVFAKGILVAFLGTAGAGAWLAWPAANSRSTPAVTRGVDKPKAAPSTAATPHPPMISTENTEEKPMEPPVAASALVSPAKPLPVRGTAAAPKVTEENTTEEKATEASSDSLLTETQRLREAHGALRGGDPEKALALLSEDAAETEGQKLREERAAARVFALCKLGRVDEANAEATAFVAQNPRSPLADRVRKACPTNP